MRRRWLAAVIVGTCWGCAGSSFTPGTCDPAKESCPCDEKDPCPPGWICNEMGWCISSVDGGMDAGPLGDRGVVHPDTFEGKDFGESCFDHAECKSGICVFAGVGGICSKLCTPGSCPKGFGCMGVLDVIEQGKVSDVCVPESNQLCTPCTEPKECSLSGKDLCLELDGLLFCGRDCAKVSCPAGYSCTNISHSGQTYKQCVPLSGACDCDVTKTGTSKACDLSTPFGTCKGSKTCLGTAGWGSCEPPSKTDVPDASFKDDNCDGIDGDISGGIFVSTAVGADGATCGLTYQDPCLTIGKGITRAAAESRAYVYVQAGTYDEVLVLQAGIHVIGGYSSSWKRDARTKAAHKVTVEGAMETTESQYMTVKAHSLAFPTTLMDLVLFGPDAKGQTPGGARSSHVVHADTAAGLTLERVTLVAGDGAAGGKGANGANAPKVGATAAMKGKPGGNGKEEFETCDNSTRGAGGAAGVNSCASSGNPGAGSGGPGGTMDTCCDCLFGQCTCLTCNCDATNGAKGNNAKIFLTLGYGYGGPGGPGKNTCGPGIDGNDGRKKNGTAGKKGAGGFVSGSYWYASSGGAGGTGLSGGGGGGGGGAGGCDSGTDSSGAGGGGGGAGGCAALSGGGGGGGGGGSFGIFAMAATITITDCEIQLGNGGDGGDGGKGGQGQSGGAGGNGGLGGSGASDGGDGGKGGHGGHGGGGGGGTGGVSYGIYSYKSNIILQKCSFSGGSAGQGGQGGVSAPAAPVAERDGLPGQDGEDAPAPANVGTCSTLTSCN